jgi:hypothetical protein
MYVLNLAGKLGRCGRVAINVDQLGSHRSLDKLA